MAHAEGTDQDGAPERGAADSTAPRFLAVGRIVAPFGLQGQVKAQILTEFPARFAHLTAVYVDEIAYRVEGSLLHKGAVILKLAGVDSVEAAEGLRGRLVEVPLAEAVRLPAGHYYDYQVLGLRVLTTGGDDVGPVVEILHTAANDVYIVATARGQALIPAIGTVVKEIDPEHGRILIETMPGLLP